MKKQVFGRRFKRDRNERKALFSGLISAMVLHGRIKTTEEKAKAIKSEIEKLVTKAKKEEGVARKLLQSSLKKHEIEKMINEIAPGFKNRAGGYTRIIKTGNRFSDNASMAVMEWSEMEVIEKINQKSSVRPVRDPQGKQAQDKNIKSQKSERAGKKIAKGSKETKRTRTGSTKTKTAKKPVRKTVKPTAAKAKAGKKGSK